MEGGHVGSQPRQMKDLDLTVRVYFIYSSISAIFF